MNSADARKIYWDNVHDIANRLINDEGVVNGRIAETNATGWGLEPSDEPKIQKVSSASFQFESTILLSGDSDDERGWCGDEMTVELSGTFKKVDGVWAFDAYEVLSAITNFDRSGDEPEEDES